MTLAYDQGGAVKNLRVHVHLGGKPPEGVSVALELVAGEGAIDDGHVYSDCATQPELVNEPRVRFAAMVRRQAIMQGGADIAVAHVMTVPLAQPEKHVPTQLYARRSHA